MQDTVDPRKFTIVERYLQESVSLNTLFPPPQAQQFLVVEKVWITTQIPVVETARCC
jgi:hypothetical protein